MRSSIWVYMYAHRRSFFAFPKTIPRLVRWYRMAAEQGDAKAQFNLGYNVCDTLIAAFHKTIPRQCDGIAWPQEQGDADRAVQSGLHV